MSRKLENPINGLNKASKGAERAGIADYARLAIALVFLSGCGATGGAIKTNAEKSIDTKPKNNPVNICYDWHANADSKNCESLKDKYYPSSPNNDGLFRDILRAARLEGIALAPMTECTSDEDDMTGINLLYSCEGLSKGEFTATKAGNKNDEVTELEISGEKPLDLYRRIFRSLFGKNKPSPTPSAAPTTTTQPASKPEDKKAEPASSSPATSTGTAQPAPTPPEQPATGAQEIKIKPEFINNGVLAGVGKVRLQDILVDPKSVASVTIQLGKVKRGKQQMPEGVVKVKTIKAADGNFMIDKAFGADGQEIALADTLKGKKFLIFDGDILVETITTEQVQKAAAIVDNAVRLVN
jgi:hypothetical protein